MSRELARRHIARLGNARTAALDMASDWEDLDNYMVHRLEEIARLCDEVGDELEDAYPGRGRQRKQP